MKNYLDELEKQEFSKQVNSFAKILYNSTFYIKETIDILDISISNNK